MQGILADKQGFDSCWFGHHFIWTDVGEQFSETFTTLAAIGMKTKHITVNSGVVDPLARHPATIAQIVASLDRLTRGRAVLGIGTGEAMNLVPFGIEWKKPVSRLKEAVEVIKKLWVATPGNPANFSGAFFRLANAFIQIRPVQKPHPPIYVGALGQRTRQVAGESADGWFGSVSTPELYALRLNDLREGAKRAGRSLDAIDKVALLNVAVSDDSNAARRAVEMPSKFELLTEKEVLKSLGYAIRASEDLSMQHCVITSDKSRIFREHLKDIPFDAVERISAFGTAEDCIDKIDEFVRAGANHIVIRNRGPIFINTLKIFREKIMPYFRTKK